MLKKKLVKTVPGDRDSPGTGLEVEAITVLPVCFRPNELEFEQRKQRVNPISELSKG
jgi:hypothetical protein